MYYNGSSEPERCKAWTHLVTAPPLELRGPGNESARPRLSRVTLNRGAVYVCMQLGQSTDLKDPGWPTKMSRNLDTGRYQARTKGWHSAVLPVYSLWIKASKIPERVQQSFTMIKRDNKNNVIWEHASALICLHLFMCVCASISVCVCVCVCEYACV